MAQFCENCGSPLTPDVRFCEKCGQPVAPQPEEMVSEKEIRPSPPPPLHGQLPPRQLMQTDPKSKKEYLIVGGIAAVLILLVGIGITYLLSKKAPQDVKQQTSVTNSTIPAAVQPEVAKPETSALAQVPDLPRNNDKTIEVQKKSETSAVNNDRYVFRPSKPQRHVTSHGCSSTITLFDNWNTGACGFTNTARGRLSNKALVTKIAFWSDTTKSNGRLNGLLQGPGVSKNVTTRCVKTFHQWCEESVQINEILPAGKYTFKANFSSLCQNAESGGIGYIRMEGCVQQ